METKDINVLLKLWRQNIVKNTNFLLQNNNPNLEVSYKKIYNVRKPEKLLCVA